MRLISSGAIAAILTLSATSAQAQKLANPGAVSTRITYTSAAAVAAGRTGGAYTGVGSLFVSTVSTATTGFGSLCTGALLSSNVVLTAGHCLSDVNEAGVRDPVTSVSFFLPSIRAAGATSYEAVSWQVSPTYTGDATEGGDFALFKLGTRATGVDTYSIYEGDPLAEYTRVGTGTIGGPEGTGTGGVTQDYAQREGRNLYEFYGDLVTGWSGNILLSDFDDGTDAHDVFGQLLGADGSQRGVTGESNSSPGDSGGPEFIDGKIVAVTSFGISGNAFTDQSCGLLGSIDPYGAGGTTGGAAGAAGCTNSSIGEVSGDTWLLPYKGYIASYVAAAAVPEPASWAMMIGGFGFVGGALRARRRTLGVRFA